MPTVKKKPNKFALLAEKRLAAKKKKLVTSDKRMPFLSTRPLDNVKGFLGVNPGKSTVEKRKQILISKLDKLSEYRLKSWLSKHYSKVIKKPNTQRDATGAQQRRLTYKYIMETPISSTAVDDLPKPFSLANNPIAVLARATDWAAIAKQQREENREKERQLDAYGRRW
jgi:hypothetical protein